MVGDENGSSQGFWPQEDEVVPLASATAVIPRGAHGDCAERDRGDDVPLARTPGLNAGEFTPERMIRPTAEAPTRGWRRKFFLLTGGLVMIGPSPAELRQRELVATVKTPISGCRKVAFISRKGGVGKTTTCLLAGHTFALYRGDRIIAVDGNPDAGTLGHRVRRETTANLTSLLGDADPRITQAIGEAEFQRAIRLLEHHYNLVCLDTGTGVLESATRGILNAADQIVVVSAPSLDGARAASSTLDWLEENGHENLVRGAVAVLNAVRPSDGLVDLDRIEAHFASRCRTCVRIPWDPHLEAGAEATLDELGQNTRAAFLEVAASIASGFAETNEGRS